MREPSVRCQRLYRFRGSQLCQVVVSPAAAATATAPGKDAHHTRQGPLYVVDASVAHVADDGQETDREEGEEAKSELPHLAITSWPFPFCRHDLLHAAHQDRRADQKHHADRARIRQGTLFLVLAAGPPIILQITGTIASVRRNRRPTDDHFARDDDRYQEPSFIAETSFVRAPLNSRVSIGAAPPKPKGKATATLEHVPLDVQEALVLEDLLYVLMGIEGTYISYHPDYDPADDDPLQGVRFTVSSASLDPSLQDLVERILPLGTYYTAISSFIEHRSDLDYGLVNHALCAAIRDMLKDYQTLLSQLEHAFNFSPQFSLQKLWFYVHPTIHTLSLIYQLVLELGSADDPSGDLSSSASDQSSELDPEEEARNEALGIGGAKFKAVINDIDKNGLASSSSIAVKGGEVLTIIYERMQNMSGDPTASMLYGTLLRAAGKPYVAMVKMWITTGRLDDPHEELLVKEAKFIDRGILDMDYTDEYWERRYTLRDGTSSTSAKRQAGVPSPRSIGGRLPGGACVPPLLEGWKHKILLAGKYLNVIRECGIENQRDSSDSEVFDMDDERLAHIPSTRHVCS